VPDRWLDPTAWRKLDRVLHLFVRLDAMELAAWTPESLQIQGTVDGTIVYQRDEKNLDIDVVAREVRTPDIAVPVSARLRGGVGPSGTSLRLESEIEGRPGPTVEGKAALSASEMQALAPEALADQAFEINAKLPSLPIPLIAKAARLPEDWVETSTGAVSFELYATNDPTWQVNLHLDASGELHAGAPALDADVRLELDEQGLAVTSTIAGEGFGHLSARYDLGSVRGAEAVFRRWSQGKLDVSVKELTLTAVRSLVVLPLPLRGTIDGDLTWDRSKERGETRFVVRELQWSPLFEPAETEIAANWNEQRTEVSATLGLTDGHELRIEQTIDGSVEEILQDPMRRSVNGSLAIRDMPAGAIFFDRFDERRFGGEVTLTATVAGPLSGPDVTARLAWDEPRIGTQRFEQIGLNALYRQGEVLTADVRLRQGDGGELEIAGRITPSTSEVELAVSAQAFSVDFLSEILALALSEAVAVSGELEADLRITGTTGDPSLDGQLQWHDGAILVPGATPNLRDLELALSARGDALELQLDAKSGDDGELRASGSVDLSTLTQPVVDLEVRAEDLEYLVASFPLEIDSRIDIEGRWREDFYGLRVDVRDMLVRVTEDSVDASLHPVRTVPDVVRVESFGVRPREERAPPPSRATDPLVLRISIENDDPIRVRSVDAQAVVDVDINADVGRSATRIGGVALVTDGTVALFGKTYRILEAQVRFGEEVPPNPSSTWSCSTRSRR
ncbi:MAG: type II secretion system protein GspN, partial [Myxococcales bacterium]|nr:type II secretion system protein GspN [Myxococcales bacterium]